MTQTKTANTKQIILLNHKACIWSIKSTSIYFCHPALWDVATTKKKNFFGGHQNNGSLEIVTFFLNHACLNTKGNPCYNFTRDVAQLTTNCKQRTCGHTYTFNLIKKLKYNNNKEKTIKIFKLNHLACIALCDILINCIYNNYARLLDVIYTWFV